MALADSEFWNLLPRLAVLSGDVGVGFRAKEMHGVAQIPVQRASGVPAWRHSWFVVLFISLPFLSHHQAAHLEGKVSQKSTVVCLEKRTGSTNNTALKLALLVSIQ